MRADVIVIGGGVSGLATAYDLKQRGHSVVLLERQRQFGGSAVSERLDGFLMEHGPSTMNALVPAANEFSQDLGLENLRCDLGDGIRKRYLVSGGQLSGIGMGAFGFLTASYLSPWARLRILLEVLVPHGSPDADESVMEFCARRFGREFAERVMDPMVAGIYGGGRAAELSVAAIFPMLVALEEKYGSVTLGIMHRRREGGKMPGSRLFSWRGGIGTLASSLALGLGDDVRTGVAVRRFSASPSGFEVDLGRDGRMQGRAVVIATQAHVAAQLIADVDPSGAAAAAQIQAPPLAVVFLGYRRGDVAHPLDGLGFLTAEAENQNILGSQFNSTMFPGRAPDGHVAVSAYIGGVRAPDLARRPAAELVDLVRAEFGDLLGVSADPVVAKVRHWPVGLPQYGAGHRALIDQLSSCHDRQSGLFLTGNYFAGPSVATCLSVAQKTAQATHEYLRGNDQIAAQRAVI
ncbi:MAG: protoporphyrinogen oxidase [Alphaproteobacteria bacterium]|jgi:oxygen-dependent protoporphyrinogen oxidase|nr:protoporphyrinogen oxidase [Rhodospirillaceae bacterium]MDP6023489.1 protoporphyrinogen oxidase [Alphaproteobacteria bacterium]MDP6257427.1 protoporphyrinogen oxidase [Alphaproteobacteria bacterium]MDP7056029.1 protoporphyrinogen oxidase [Alphaproteobacteria bacterium]MDP7229177.1 protoporphyrinogen oxidase [Alphaproteobacteria bacterium]